MGLIGSIVGGVASTVGSIWGGNAAASGYEKERELYNQRLADIKAHRDKVYYQDPTQTAESQAAVTQAQQVLAQQNQRTKDKNIVSGGTDESVALEKQAGAAAVGNMLQQQAVSGAAKKEQAYQNAEGQIDSFTKYLAESKKQQALAKAQAIQDAAAGVAKSAQGLDFGGQVGKTGMTW